MTASGGLGQDILGGDAGFAYLTVGLMLVAAVLAQWFMAERVRHPENVYSPRLAWMRAGMYFCCVLIVSLLTGVLPAVILEPFPGLVFFGDPLWLVLTLLVLVSVIWGYMIWWPRGTLTHGRPSVPVPALLFGLAWGACSGLLLLSAWAIIGTLGLPPWLTALLVLFVFSAWSQLYQAGWWDIHVSPPHNIRAWNARKVLFGHMPFLVLALTHYALFGQAGLYVGFNMLAMASASVAMCFPPFWAPDGPEVSRETALGV
ncbi:MAG: hypothetical protein JJT85_08910 [Chromatiales bacterium]|nr:hypothetical protein [Chromatiales bacterium]